MLSKLSFSLLALSGLSVGFWFSPLVAAPPGERPADQNALIAELTRQQVQIVANQAAIDAALAAVKEEIRLARAFSARSGGKVVVP